MNRVALFVWGSARPGGAERRFLRLFAHLQQAGYDVLLYTSNAGLNACRSLGIELNDRDVRVLTESRAEGSRFRRYAALLKYIFELIRRIRADRVQHIHFGENPGPFSLMYGLFRRFGCPFSVSLVNSTRSYLRNRRQRLYVRAAVVNAKSIDCLSEQIRTDLISFVGVHYAHKCLVSPCSFTDARTVSASVDLRSRDIDIALVARMVPGKGHRLLRDALMAWEGVGGERLVVHVCGSGPIEPQVRYDFQSLRTVDVQIYFEPRPLEVLSRTKIYVSLQEEENYPSQSLLEAMTCGCAIVATDVGLTRSLLNESCAMLVPCDAEPLALAIRTLIEDETLRQRLGLSAKRIVATQHTIERFASYFVREVLGGASLTSNGLAASMRGLDQIQRTTAPHNE